MKVVCRKPGIPRVFATHPAAKGLLHERDLRIGTSRLRAKLLIFDTNKSLVQFWMVGLRRPNPNSGLGRKHHCAGVVNALSYTETDYLSAGNVEQNSRRIVDPRYFCVIGLLANAGKMEEMSHEAVHAAFAYAQRVNRSPWDQHARDMDEEAIAYPTGRIAKQINATFHDLRERKIIT